MSDSMTETRVAMEEQGLAAVWGRAENAPILQRARRQVRGDVAKEFCLSYLDSVATEGCEAEKLIKLRERLLGSLGMLGVVIMFELIGSERKEAWLTVNPGGLDPESDDEVMWVAMQKELALVG